MCTGAAGQQMRCFLFQTHHIGRQLVAWQVFHVFMVCVDDFGEFAVVHRLLKHPHVNRGVKLVIFGCVGTNNLGNGRSPVEIKDT